MQFVTSDSLDTSLNLALEEFLFRRRPFLPAFMLYRNGRSVLCGRNQSPACECDLDFCRTNGIGVFRRISGGGTVFHDPGNLNCAFLVPRSEFVPERYMSLLTRLLTDIVGRPVTLDARMSAWIDGRKVMGSAFALAGDAALLHCCLLINTDLPMLESVLASKVPDTSLVKSLHAPVLNLSSFDSEINVENVSELITLEIADTLGIDSLGEMPPEAMLASCRDKYLSDAWTFRNE